jgi:hypothetical protein
VWCFFIGKKKVVLFPTFRKNEGEGKGREAARNALINDITVPLNFPSAESTPSVCSNYNPDSKRACYENRMG